MIGTRSRRWDGKTAERQRTQGLADPVGDVSDACRSVVRPPDDAGDRDRSTMDAEAIPRSTIDAGSTTIPRGPCDGDERSREVVLAR
jgi:hypothetical protein